MKERAFLYEFFSCLDAKAAAASVGIGKGYAELILAKVGKTVEFSEIMDFTGLSDLALASKLAGLLHAKRSIVVDHAVTDIDAPDIQIKAVELSLKARGRLTGDQVNLNFYQPIRREQAEEELAQLE